MLRTQTLIGLTEILCASTSIWESKIAGTELLPATIQVMAYECGQFTKIRKSRKQDHRKERLNILEDAWFWNELTPPFQSPLQACWTGALLNQVESDQCQNPQTFIKSFFRR